MCGLLGGWRFDGSMNDYRARFSSGLRAIRHRGPDSSSEFADERVYLGHNRLSIIDLSAAANQPLKSATDQAWIIYNGEIYNFEELRKSLERTRTFATRSDTEVILEGYLAEGISFFQKLRGIYAFAILDRRANQRTILARDPAGTKPLYYVRDRDGLAFGSEIKALLAVVGDTVSIDERVIKAYLNVGFCPEPYTIYREIRALPPGHTAVVAHDEWREVPSHIYEFDDENEATFEDNLERTSSLLAQAVRRNLVADVDTAVALSGGIDSSLVYAHATRANNRSCALTVRFDDPSHDESSLAEAYARQLAGKQLTLSVDADFTLAKLNELLLHFDQPFADSSAVPVYYLTRATRPHSKVLIGGDGGDELFNGYASLATLPAAYRAQRLRCATALSSVMKMAASVVDDGVARTLRRGAAVLTAEPCAMLFDWLSWLPRDTRSEGRSPFLYPANDGLRLYEEVLADRLPRRFTARLTFEHFSKLLLSDYLRKTDMMAMLNGIEYRVPLLDEDLVRFALSIPFWQKSSVRRPKKILRRLHAEIFPRVASEAQKKGFSIPMDRYLSGDDFAAMSELVLRRDSFVQLFVDRRYLRFVFEAVTRKTEAPAHFSRAGTYQRALLFYSLELWHARRRDHMHAMPGAEPANVHPLVGSPAA